ncbi:MarC family NAAT transporter [Paenochrobactrum sp. BZR 588]|uniref:MarC family NAAT transporter n=1 Tax=Paenochrobactrum sp. BZR 588 TaxID=3378076 RepID=UPI0038524199
MVHYIPLIVLGILPIMNPVSTVPLFLALTGGMTEEHKLRQARMACFYAFLILSVFLCLGNVIISFFGISLAGIRVAGGLIILMLSFRMLFPADMTPVTKSGVDSVKEATVDFSFSPLAMPSISGPGTIAVVMGYGSQIPDEHSIAGHAIVIMGIAIAILFAYMTLLFSGVIAKFLGEHGIQAVSKIMGFLLACVSVQFLASGIHEFIINLGTTIQARSN